MKKIMRTVACVSILAGLTACEKSPFGADAGSDAGSSNSTSENIGRDRSISRSGSSSASITMPAYPLLVDAARNVLELKTNNDIYYTFAQALMEAPEYPWPENYEELNNEEIERLNEEVARHNLNGFYSSVDTLPAMCGKMLNSEAMRSVFTSTGLPEFEFYRAFVGGGVSSMFSELVDLMPGAAGGDAEESSAEASPDPAVQKVKAALAKFCPSTAPKIDKKLFNSILYVGRPCQGWVGRFVDEENTIFARNSTHHVIVANLVAAEALKGISSITLKDPDHAKKVLADRLIKLSQDQKFVASVQAAGLQKINANMRFNFAGSSEPVEFIIDGNTAMACGKNGWSMHYNGIDYFGGGKVMGQDVALALESVVSTSETRSSGTSSSSDTSTSQRSGSRVGTPQ